MSMSQFAPRRIIETPFTPHSEGSYCLRVNGQLTDIINNGYVPGPASPPYATSVVRGQPDPRGRTPSDETDSPSPALTRTYSYDEALFDFRKVAPEKIAAQITLLDLPLFKAVTPQELRGCGWTKKDKKERAPNVVAFIHRFNHTSYWVMDDVLNEESPKVRAEIISQFIRVAKKLHELNNIHSLKAIIAGLQSAPIYRLSQTWRCVHKKDMNTYSRLVEFLSEENNWKRLRDHTDMNILPCIPYLGLFLTDLCFISEVPNKRGQTDSICNTIAYFQNSTYDDLLPESHIQKFLTRTICLEELQRVFEDDKFRLSLKYEPSGASPSPRTDSLRQSKSYEDLLGPFTTDRSQETDPLTSKPITPVIAANGALLYHRHSYHNIRDRRNTLTVPLGIQPSIQTVEAASSPQQLLGQATSPFRFSKSSKINTHLHVQLAVGGNPFEDGAGGSPHSKKSSTLPKEIRVDLPSSPRTHSRRLQSESEEKARKLNHKSLVPWKSKHRKAQSLGGNALSAFGIQRISPTHSGGEPHMGGSGLSWSLIDDNDDAFSGGTHSSFTGSAGNLSTTSGLSSLSCDSSEVVLVQNDEQGYQAFYDEEDDDAYDVNEEHLAMPIIQGELKKKLLKKAGKSVSQLRHRKKACWVQLNEEYLLLLGSKPRPTSSASHWRNSKPKLKGFISKLKDCRVKYKDPSEKMNDKQFILVDDKGSHIRFDAKNASKAMEWVEAIREAIYTEQEKEKQRVNQSLIQFNDP